MSYPYPPTGPVKPPVSRADKPPVSRADKPPVSRADLVGSICVLVLTFVGGGVAAFFGVFFMAFTDYCPPATCHIDAGVNAMLAGFLAAAVLGVAGTVVTVIRLVMRRLAWPFAAATMGLCAVACGVALAGYLVAVGG